MKRRDDTEQRPEMSTSDGDVWRSSRLADAVEDEIEHFLDLAGFADGLLDPDERERVAEMLAADPVAAADVAALRSLKPSANLTLPAPERVIARACRLVESRADRALRAAAPASSNVVQLGAPQTGRARFDLARWGSLAAALAIASWLGFAMGSDTSRVLDQTDRGSDASFLNELLEPSTGFLRDLTEGMPI